MKGPMIGLATLCLLMLAACESAQRDSAAPQTTRAEAEQHAVEPSPPTHRTTTPTTDAGAVTADAPPTSFPESWFGTWAGEVTARQTNGSTMRFPMRLEIGRTDRDDVFVWRIIYGSGARQQVRDYRLVTVDAAAGRYRIDEQNSIEIDCFLVGPTLHSMFAVQEAILPTRYTWRDDRLHFELESYNFGRPIQTGGAENIPAVLAYGLQVAQHAPLERIATTIPDRAENVDERPDKSDGATSTSTNED